MQVQEIMSCGVELTGPETTVLDAARKMRAEIIGALPVGENNRLIGMITDRDIVMRAVADDRPSSETTVREVMSEKICYCFDDNDIDEAASVMAEHQVRRLPVLNRSMRLVGMIALADLSRCQSDSAKVALEGISKATGEARHMPH